MILIICNKGPNKQTGKGPGKKILKNMGSEGVNIKISPLAVTFFIVHPIFKMFSVNSLEQRVQFKNCSIGHFSTPYRGFNGMKMITLSQLKKKLISRPKVLNH